MESHQACAKAVFGIQSSVARRMAPPSTQRTRSDTRATVSGIKSTPPRKCVTLECQYLLSDRDLQQTNALLPGDRPGCAASTGRECQVVEQLDVEADDQGSGDCR